MSCRNRNYLKCQGKPATNNNIHHSIVFGLFSVSSRLCMMLRSWGMSLKISGEPPQRWTSLSAPRGTASDSWWVLSVLSVPTSCQEHTRRVFASTDDNLRWNPHRSPTPLHSEQKNNSNNIFAFFSVLAGERTRPWKPNMKTSTVRYGQRLSTSM